MSGYDMLDHMALLKGIAAADRKLTVEMLLQQVNLSSVPKTTLARFSGGMRQRFGVTDRRPTHAGVDPYNFQIDRNSGDNVVVGDYE